MSLQCLAAQCCPAATSKRRSLTTAIPVGTPIRSPLRQRNQTKPHVKVTNADDSKKSDVQASANTQPSPPPDPVEAPEPTLGLLGNIVVWSILLFTFAGSLFFTFLRQLLPDMVPLDPSQLP